MKNQKLWEVSCIAFESKNGTIYKVTRRIPALYVSETRLFYRKEEAILHCEEWLT